MKYKSRRKVYFILNENNEIDIIQVIETNEVKATIAPVLNNNQYRPSSNMNPFE